VKAVLLRVGRGGVPWADAAVEDYARRFRAKLPYEEERIRPAPERGDVEAVRVAEAEALLARVRAGDRVVALDERGQVARTEELAGWVDTAAREGVRRVVFLIGGPYGHGPAVRAAAWRCLSLSPMVLNHELARVILVEQLYRVSTLLWGGSYHHGGP
jgi:23S rRNA (pseudouridine1915-N3)-methyltransferase